MSDTPGTQTVNLRSPKTQEEIGITWTLRSEYSSEVKAVKNRHTNEMIRQGRGRSLSAEKLDQNGLDILWAASVSVTFTDDCAEPKFEFSESAVKKFLRDKPWYKNQLDTALGDEAAFFQS